MPIVRHHDQAAFEALQGHGQGLAHFDIQMIGRLVEQQQIGPPRHQQCQRQPGLLAAGKTADRFERAVTLKAEASQVVAYFLLIAHREVRTAPVAQMPKCVAVRLELLQLLLREIADREIRGGGAFSRERRRFAGKQFGQSGFARAIRPEQRDSIERADRDIDAAQDLRAIVAARGIFQGDERPRRFQRLRKLEFEWAVDVCRHDALHPLQHFQAALGLPRLGGRGAKPVHEGGDFRDALHLPGMQHDLKRQFLGALLFELRIVAGVCAEGSILDVQYAIDDRIEKFPVMRNHQQGARICCEPFLQPDDGIEIQVVGGLIQQQKIGAGTERTRHGQAHPPAARKFRNGALLIRRFESQAVHDRRRAGFGAIAVDGFQRRIEFGERDGGIAPLRIVDGTLHAAQLGVAIQHEFDRGSRARGDFLLDVRNFDGRRHIDVAAVGGELPQ